MALTAMGLILREHNIGEADRFVTILTNAFGVIRASVRGARRVNSKSGASTKTLSYARLSLVKGRNNFIVETASPVRLFCAGGVGIEELALAQYFCELFEAAAPREDEATPYLQLLLNSLHFLEKGEQRDRIKAITECRLMSMVGYMPDLHACRCGNGTLPLYFSPISGVLGCAQCRQDGDVPISKTTYDALCHVIYGEPSKCFSFRLPDAACLEFADIAEQFVIRQLSRRFKTLEIYHSLISLQETSYEV